MFNTKLFSSMLLVLAVVLAQVGNVAAAPRTQDTTLMSGTVESVATETDATGVTTVLVTLVDDQGTTQTVRLSLETALILGLVTIDPATQQPVVDETQYGQLIEIDPAVVIPDEEPTEEDIHPIAAILAEFFGEDPGVVNGYHEDGFGFGVIAQALWMSQNVSEDESADVTLAGCILDAKKNGTYGECFDFGDQPVPTNWGQFKQAMKENKDKHNLGVIVSGHGEEENGPVHGNQGNGQNKNKDKNKNKP